MIALIGFIIYGLIIAGIIYIAFMAVGGFLALVAVIVIGMLVFGLICWGIAGIIGLFKKHKNGSHPSKPNNYTVTTSRVTKWDKK